ncbi:limonene-1,2-epoxide hydrolase family protein, partial [Acinetobacter baumannii]
ERTDEFVYKGHHGKVPVVGILEVEGDHVKVWREYYDRAELLREMGIGEEFHKPAAAH